jgi:hypothetical protein
LHFALPRADAATVFATLPNANTHRLPEILPKMKKAGTRQPPMAATCIPCGITSSALSIMVATG